MFSRHNLYWKQASTAQHLCMYCVAPQLLQGIQHLSTFARVGQNGIKYRLRNRYLLF
jgi:hypothetical protein